MFVSHKSAPESESGQYAAVLMHMEDLSVNCKNADIQGRARHVSQKMKDIYFAAFCHFLADLFAKLSRVSLQMQRNDIILPSVVSHLKETLVRIESVTLRPVADGHLAKFWEKVEGTQTFQGVTLTGSIVKRPNMKEAYHEAFSLKRKPLRVSLCKVFAIGLVCC